MTYMSMSAVRDSHSLYTRIVAAAADEGIASPDVWVAQRLWPFAAQPGWVEAWEYAADVYTVNSNPDTGARTDVISDAMILSAVQALNV